MQEGLRSSNAFVLRRCQILLANARGQTARLIGEALGCDDQTVRNVLHTFNTRVYSEVCNWLSSIKTNTRRTR